MRFGEVFRYELSYRARSLSTWLYGGFLFLIAFWIIHVAATGTNPIHLNAPKSLAETMALFCGLFGMLVTAGLVSDAAVRDRADRMEPLLFTTRLRPSEYLGGRFLAALAINAVLLFAIPIGMALATMMPYLQRDAFGPNRILAYLQPMVLFLLPNVVLVGTILFTIAATTRKAIPVYLGAIGIFIGYIAAANYWGSITNPVLSILADPLGINAFKELTEYWTLSERNARLIGFPTMLLWNRLLWMSIASVLFGALVRLFRFRESERRGRRTVNVDAPGEARRAVAVPQISGVHGARTRVRQTLAVARQSLAELMSGGTIYAALLAAIGLIVLWGWNVGESWLDTITWPVTHLVAGVVVTQRAIVIPWLVIALYAGELVWKDRETEAAGIADAMPVRTGVLLLGRFLALVTVIAMFQAAFMIGGILLQVLHGYYRFEPGLYVRMLFGMDLVEHILLAAFAMTVHVLVNHKYVGHLLVLLATFFNHSVLNRAHHLFIYNSGPERIYSEMNGFGSVLEAFVWFKLYWGAWALLFGVVAMLFWVRGTHLGIRSRFATARARLTGSVARVAVVATALILALGGFIFYNTNVLNDFLPAEKAAIRQAEHERRYGRYRDLPQPVVDGAELRFEIYPEKHSVDMAGSYRLVNRSSAPIGSIHVETPNGSDYEVRSMKFDRSSKPELVDPKFGYRIFALQPPLAPGESLRFSFEIALRPRGFPHGGLRKTVVPNGSYFDRLLLPFIGYQPAFEVSEDDVRKRLGLPPRVGIRPPAYADARNRSVLRDGERIHVETIVGTAPDQVAVVPGVLRRTWSENGRRYFHYGTRIPEAFGTAVFSAKYAVHEARWHDVALQIFHHPPHRQNLERMTAAMKSSLDFYTSEFGPFPYRELRVVEIPPYSINGRAFPSAMAFSEPNFITRVEPGLVDLTFFGTAHEIAHQWWGGQVTPAYAKGREFVSESLANYSAMLVTEKALGAAEAKRVFDFQMDRYLRRRGETGLDAPLLEVDDHPHVAYGKGAVALYTLREEIGAERVNLALRRFLQKYGRSGPPYPTSLDLYAELRAVTPSSQHNLLRDLFETMTLWDVKAQGARTRRLANGKYEVLLSLTAQKLRASRTGVDTPTPMDDLIEIGVFAGEEVEPSHVVRHRIRTGEQTIRIVVPTEPSRAGIDPRSKLIERERDDNVVEVEREG